MKGLPIPATTWPMITQANAWFISSLNETPIIPKAHPITIPTLVPQVSMTNEAGKVNMGCMSTNSSPPKLTTTGLYSQISVRKAAMGLRVLRATEIISCDSANMATIKNLLGYSLKSDYRAQASMGLLGLQDGDRSDYKDNKFIDKSVYFKAIMLSQTQSFVDAYQPEDQPQLTKKQSDAPYLTSQLIFHHSKQYAIDREDQLPSFLKQSIDARDKGMKNYVHELDSDSSLLIENLLKISNKVYRDALRRGVLIKELIRSKNAQGGQLETVASRIGSRTIKLKDILDHEQEVNKRMLTASARKVTLQEDECLNFEVDENLNYVRSCNMIKEQSENLETDRCPAKNEQMEQKQPTKQLHPKQYELECNAFSQINGIESREFWLSSQELQVDKQLGANFLGNKTWNMKKQNLINQDSSKTTRKVKCRISDFKDMIRTEGENSNRACNSDSQTHFNSTDRSTKGNAQKLKSLKLDSPQGIYEEILSEYSTAKLLAINKQYTQGPSHRAVNKSKKNPISNGQVRNGFACPNAKGVMACCNTKK